MRGKRGGTRRLPSFAYRGVLKSSVLGKVDVSGSFPELRDGAQNPGRRTWLYTARHTVGEVRAYPERT